MTPITAQVSRALAATLSIQAVVTMATLTVPVFAPAAAGDIGLDPSYIGIFASIIYAGAMASSLLSGGLAPRHGAIRVSQSPAASRKTQRVIRSPLLAGPSSASVSRTSSAPPSMRESPIG